MMSQPKPQPKPATEKDHTKLVAKVEKIVKEAQQQAGKSK